MGDEPPVPRRDEMVGYHFVFTPEDLEVSHCDWVDGRHCITIGSSNGCNCMKVVGDLDDLAQIFGMGESLVEQIRIRKELPAGFEEEKQRAEGE